MYYHSTFHIDNFNVVKWGNISFPVSLCYHSFIFHSIFIPFSFINHPSSNCNSFLPCFWPDVPSHHSGGLWVFLLFPLLLSSVVSPDLTLFLVSLLAGVSELPPLVPPLTGFVGTTLQSCLKCLNCLQPKHCADANPEPSATTTPSPPWCPPGSSSSPSPGSPSRPQVVHSPSRNWSLISQHHKIVFLWFIVVSIIIHSNYF